MKKGYKKNFKKLKNFFFYKKKSSLLFKLYPRKEIIPNKNLSLPSLSYFHSPFHTSIN